MTQQEKLQQLFDAALKDTSEVTKPLTRSFPEVVPVKVAPQIAAPEAELVAVPLDAEKCSDLVTPMPNAGMDDVTSKELGALLDEQRARIFRRNRRNSLVTALVLLSGIGGTYGWFVQSPQRVQAWNEAVRDIRSVGDLAGMVAKYRVALDQISARGQQIDEATAAMGVKADARDSEDPYFDAEMKQMMGGEGKTIGERNKLLDKKLGHMAKKAPDQLKEIKEPQSVTKTASGSSFDWKK